MTPATAQDEVVQDEVQDEDVALDAGEEPLYEPPTPTEDQLKAANAVFDELKKRGPGFGAEATIEALLQLVDIHPMFRTSEEWMGDDKAEYAAAAVPANIGKFLLVGCRHLELEADDVIFLFRNKDKWMQGDRPKRGQVRKLDTRMQHLLNGRVVTVEVNYHHWLTMNPLQKIQAIYHLLRQVGKAGKKRAPDFYGYLDELEVFGLRTYRELLALESTLQRAKDVSLPHQLSLFEA